MNEKKLVILKGALPPANPLSPALIYENLVFISGQTSRDLITREPLLGDIKQETEQVINNIQQLLEAAGSSLDCVLKTTVYITDKSYSDEMNKIYEAKFPGPVRPARSTIVTAKVGDAKIEIEAIGYIPKEKNQAE